MDTNPVGALQERYQSRGIFPNYRVVQVEGMSHNPFFTYEVNIDGMNAIGTGKSKKEAKHSAAKAMLDKLDGRVPALPPTTMPKENPAKAQASQAAPNDENGNSPTNPIGSLQEYCVKYRFPNYRVVQVEGMSHNPFFTYEVNIDGMNAIGTGKSKKEAKHSAAKAMLDKLDGRVPALPPTTMPKENPAKAQASQAAPNDENGNSPTNPIGSLQEYCVKYSLPMPIFDLGHNSRLDVQRFVIVAKVGQFMSAGYGLSKNDAKREAAVTLLEELKELGGNFNVTVQANEGSGSAHVGNDKVITIDEDEPTLKKRRI